MKTGTDNRKDMMLWGVLGVFALGSCIYIYEEVFAGSSSAPAPSTVVVSAPAVPSARTSEAGTTTGRAAKTLGTTSAALDPTLHMDAMLVSESVEYSGTGRNIFSPNSAPPVVIPQPKAPARPSMTPVIAPVPCPPNCPPPPPPPPIDLKFFGVETAAGGERKALLLQGENVFVASAGEVVMRRYRVIAVDAKSIQVEDMQNHNKQTLPLLVN